jgi:hypothetical protein
MPPTKNDLEMIEALRAYAAEHGKQWRRKLSFAWASGRNLGAQLQRARNVIGPSGLARFKL